MFDFFGFAFSSLNCVYFSKNSGTSESSFISHKDARAHNASRRLLALFKCAIDKSTDTLEADLCRNTLQRLPEPHALAHPRARNLNAHPVPV